MKAKNIIIVEPQNQEQFNVLKAFMNALKIDFNLLKKANTILIS